MTASVARVNKVMIDPRTVDSRLSLRLGTNCKHSFDTSENDPVVLLECWNFSRATSSHGRKRVRHQMAEYEQYLLFYQSSIPAAVALEVAQRILGVYRDI